MAGREKLPFLDLINWSGLYTKGSPDVVKENQLRVAKNTDLFEVYGGVTKPPGSSRVLNAQYEETGVVQPVSWLGFYKASDLDGQILRQTLAAAGTKLHLVSGASLVALTGSGFPVAENRTSGLVHVSARFADLFFIQNQDPDLVGRGDTPVKYDGKEIQRWGIIAPGETETIIEGFSSAASFTATNGVASNESTTTQDGDAVKFSKNSQAATNGDLTKTVTAFGVNITIANRGKVFLYIPRGELTNFDETTAVEIRVGINLTTDYYDFTFGIGQLREGWNELLLDFSDSTKVTGTPGNSALTDLRFRINSKTAADVITDVRWDKFLTLDVGTPTVAEAVASGSIFSSGAKYQYKVTFVSKYGHESNAGPASVLLTLTGGKDTIELTDIPTSSDPQIVARKIYRTVNDGAIFLFVDTINDNTTTSFNDQIGDLSLGQTSPPLEGDVSDDNTPPPKAGIIKTWKRTIFMAGLPDAPNDVVFSEDDEPESFPTLNRVALDEKVTAIYETYSGLVIETELGKWQVTGENPDFRFDKIINQIGCVGRRAAGETRIDGWSVDREGMRLYDLNNPIKISEPIRDKFDDDFDKSNIELMHTAHTRNRNAILMLVANASGKFIGNNFLYQYPLDSVGEGWWWQLDLPSSINPLHFTEIEDADGTFRLYFGGDDGMIYELFDKATKDWVLADGTTEAITTEFQSKFIRLGQLADDGDHVAGRVLPRFIELRHSGDATTWEVTIDTANGSSPADPIPSSMTQTITFPFGTGDSLLRRPVPMMQPGEYVRITVKNSEANKSSTITACRLLYRVKPGQFALEPGQLGSSTS